MSGITDFVLAWFFSVFVIIIALEILSFVLFLKTNKKESNLNLKKSLNFYISEIFMFNSKNDKKVSGVLSNINIILASTFFILAIGTFVTLYFYKQELKHQQEITNAKLEVVEQFREINDRKLDD